MSKHTRPQRKVPFVSNRLKTKRHAQLNLILAEEHIGDRTFEAGKMGRMRFVAGVRDVEVEEVFIRI